MSAAVRPLFDPPLVRRAISASFVKLDPRHMARNPVMFVVLAGAALTTAILAADFVSAAPARGFHLQLAVWLWFTVLFANFAEAMAVGEAPAAATAAAGEKKEPEKKEPEKKEAAK